MSTQQTFPWRAALRTFLQTIIPLVLGLGVVVPEIVAIVLEETGGTMPEQLRAILLGAAAVCATVAAILARIMAIPRVDDLLRRLRVLSGLAAEPAARRDESGRVQPLYALLILAVVVLVVYLAAVLR